jgi:hypothetical protein
LTYQLLHKQPSARTAQKHRLPASPLAHARKLLPSNGRCSQSPLSNGSTCYSKYVSMCVCAEVGQCTYVFIYRVCMLKHMDVGQQKVRNRVMLICYLGHIQKFPYSCI